MERQFLTGGEYNQALESKQPVIGVWARREGLVFDPETKTWADPISAREPKINLPFIFRDWPDLATALSLAEDQYAKEHTLYSPEGIRGYSHPVGIRHRVI